jgi:23S rRNA (guanosine2251-2'-O)-methyltransferase
VKELLYGRQPVRECLRAHRRHIHRLLLAEGVRRSDLIADVRTAAGRLGVPVQHVARADLAQLGDAHQGVALEVGAYPYVTPDDILRHAQRRSEPPLVLALDHVQDPHNLGALLRTAEVAGLHGVVIPDRRAVGVTPAVVSASAGASEHIRVAQVTNLVRALEALKAAGVWVVGLDAGPGSRPYHSVDLDMPLVLLVGAEGHGLSRLARQVCDVLIALPMRGHTESLNASVAGGIAMYAAWAARGFHTN